MTAYLDASVILRVVLGQGGALREWRRIRRGVASALALGTHDEALAVAARAHGVRVLGA